MPSRCPQQTPPEVPLTAPDARTAGFSLSRSLTAPRQDTGTQGATAAAGPSGAFCLRGHRPAYQQWLICLQGGSGLFFWTWVGINSQSSLVSETLSRRFRQIRTFPVRERHGSTWERKPASGAATRPPIDRESNRPAPATRPRWCGSRKGVWGRLWISSKLNRPRYRRQ